MHVIANRADGREPRDRSERVRALAGFPRRDAQPYLEVSSPLRDPSSLKCITPKTWTDVYGTAGFEAETVSLIDFRILPRSLFVEITAVVSLLKAAFATSRLR